MAETQREYNVYNQSGVAVQGDSILILMTRAKMTKAVALNLAAWLVALADDAGEFDGLLNAVRNT